MNRLLIGWLAVALCAATVFAQTANEAKSGATDRAEGRLELTTEIVNRWSCGPGGLGLTLKLSFRNRGQVPVIVSKLVLTGGIRVSRSPEDAAARKYALSLRYSDFGDGDPDFGFEDPDDLSRFVVLRPGEVYESKEYVSVPTYLPATHGAKPRPEVDLRDGTYFLQIVVGTWPYVVDPDPIRAKWKDKGSLWSRGLLSAPMPFTVSKDQPVTKCPSL